MRYTYDVYNYSSEGKNKRIGTALSLAEAESDLSKLPANSRWRIIVTDNLEDSTMQIETAAKLEDWRMTRERDIWMDAADKKRIAAALEAKRILKRNEATRSGLKAWNPFDEKETGIHVTSKHIADMLEEDRMEVEASQVAIDKIGEILGKALRRRLDANEPLPQNSTKELEKSVTDRLKKKFAEACKETIKTQSNSQNLIDNNVKTAAATAKPRTSAVPTVGIFALGAAMQNGADKYGRFNWRDTTVSASVFYDAIQRHLMAWQSGEDYADDSGIHHLAHAMAGCAILLDAKLHNVFNDDRSNFTKVPTKTDWSNK